MKFSVIIPIYNTKIESLDKSIKSVLQQEYDNYEIILINDGSTNEDIEPFCMEIIKKHPSIKYIYQSNNGSASARNNGIKNSKGDYIIFLDADDELGNDVFLKIIEINDFDILFMNYNFVFSDSIVEYNLINFNELFNKGKIVSNILFYPNICNEYMFGSIWGKCFKREFIIKNNINFVDRLRKAQDRIFMINAIYNAQNIKYSPIDSYNYSINIDSITHKINYKMIDYYKYLYEEACIVIKKYGIEKKYSKFLEYGIVNEILPLTIFNENCSIRYCEKKIIFNNLYKYFNLKINLKNIKYKEIPNQKGKIKYFLIKNKLFFLLNLLFMIKIKIDNNHCIK